MKRVRKVISLLAVFCMVVTMNLTAFATSADATPSVAEARNGILQVRLYYVDDAGNSYCLQTGSGFLVGASSGAQTVITNYHVVTLPDSSTDGWDKEKASAYFGVDFFNSNQITMEARIAVKRDVELVAYYQKGSEQTDFAILELEQPIYDRVPLKIADSSSLVETQNIYALGFPSVASAVEDDSVFTVEDVTISNGIIGKFQTINNINFILHNAQLGYGNSGGPLVNSNGDVVGVNTLFYGDDSGNYYSSIAINEITSVLDALGIVYEKADGTTQEVISIIEEGNNNTNNNNNIEENNNTNNNNNIEENNNTNNNNTNVNHTLVEEEDSNIMLYVGIGVAVLVVVGAVVTVVIVNSNKKKKKQVAAAKAKGAPMPQMPGTQPNGAPVPPMGGAPVPPSFGGTVPMMDTGAGETSVLGGGAGETSVLGGGSMQPTATLIRRKNGETAKISKPTYSIGKERQKVDFCIPDNNSVSRNHANILCKGGTYYIVDRNSTNYTYVNGNKINPNQEIKLNSGDKIKLADEEFEFRL